MTDLEEVTDLESRLDFDEDIDFDDATVSEDLARLLLSFLSLFSSLPRFSFVLSDLEDLPLVVNASSLLYDLEERRLFAPSCFLASALNFF